jgi:L,D-peptidoglycan transpeptidase YkuD (ErfK/YbiS/YcfS/YnhG family)
MPGAEAVGLAVRLAGRDRWWATWARAGVDPPHPLRTTATRTDPAAGRKTRHSVTRTDRDATAQAVGHRARRAGLVPAVAVAVALALAVVAGTVASGPPAGAAPAPPPFPAAAAAGSDQVVTVTATGNGRSSAVASAYQRTPGGWKRVFGPWAAHVGYNGLAPPGRKREGDGRTPSGTFGFGFFFGVQANPGVRFPYRRVTGRSIVWDDDPASSHYNQWVDESRQGRAAAGVAPEPMYDVPAYDYGAVISYNSGPVVPGAGSAIFLHVSTGGPTAGCVSLPMAQLLAVMRWMAPTQHPRIVIGA